MRPLPLILLACLLAVSSPAAAQTVDEAKQAIDKKEFEKARVILEKLATQGNTEAEFRLAEMYVRPVGIARNTPRGFALYESAAKKGHAEAQFVFATELAKGTLIPADKKRAVGLWRTSSRLKHAGSQYALCVELGTDGGKFYDAQEAYAWCVASSGKKHGQAGDAERRGKETLRKIQAAKGPAAVDAAKERAARYARKY